MLMKSILLVEDHAETQNLIRQVLKPQYHVSIASGFDSAMNALSQTSPDLLILDVVLGDTDGFNLCKHIRTESNYTNIPILFLTGKSKESEKLHAFSLGADDYITKPFSPNELNARISALLRRTAQTNQIKSTTIDDFEFDFVSLKALYKNKELDFTPHEFKLFYYFISNKNKTLTRQSIVENVWTNKISINDRAVDVFISNLRKKLKESNCVINSIYGIGYKLSKNS